MCKVLIIPGIKKEFRANAIRFVKEMGKDMSSGNNDGLGYAAIDEEGKLFSERWFRNVEAFGGYTGEGIKLLEEMKAGFETSIGILPSETTKMGDPDLDKMVAITLHTRAATTEKCMKNVHPFIYPDRDISLIHNGIINNDKDFNLEISTCDSEAILQAYLKNKVNTDPNGVREMAQSLRGYYACGVFARDEEGKRILDVFKGNHANLYAHEVKELGTYLFSTSEHDVQTVCNRLGFTKGPSVRVKEGFLFRIDPFTGRKLTMQDFIVPPVGSWDRGSHSRGTNTNSQWAGQGTNTGSTTTESNTGGGGIVDASNQGAKEREAKRVKGMMSNEMMAMLKLKPTISELSRAQVLEYVRDNQLLSRAD